MEKYYHICIYLLGEISSITIKQALTRKFGLPRPLLLVPSDLQSNIHDHEGFLRSKQMHNNTTVIATIQSITLVLVSSSMMSALNLRKPTRFPNMSTPCSSNSDANECKLRNVIHSQSTVTIFFLRKSTVTICLEAILMNYESQPFRSNQHKRTAPE